MPQSISSKCDNSWASPPSRNPFLPFLSNSCTVQASPGSKAVYTRDGSARAESIRRFQRWRCTLYINHAMPNRSCMHGQFCFRLALHPTWVGNVAHHHFLEMSKRMACQCTLSRTLLQFTRTENLQNEDSPMFTHREVCYEKMLRAVSEAFEVCSYFIFSQTEAIETEVYQKSLPWFNENPRYMRRRKKSRRSSPKIYWIHSSRNAGQFCLWANVIFWGRGSEFGCYALQWAHQEGKEEGHITIVSRWGHWVTHGMGSLSLSLNSLSLSLNAFDAF